MDIGSGGVIGRWVVDLVHWGALPQGLPHRSIPAQGVTSHGRTPIWTNNIFIHAGGQAQHTHKWRSPWVPTAHTESAQWAPLCDLVPSHCTVVVPDKKHHFEFGMGLGNKVKLLCVRIDCVVQWNPIGWTLCGWGSMCGLDCV